jgi:hypothetical protein
MELAVSIGISINDFWELTPYELTIAVRGFYKRIEREAEEFKVKYKQLQKDMFMQAFLISRWVRQKKVDIEKLLDDEPEKKEMTDEEMLAQVKIWNQMLGGEVNDAKE